MIKQIKDEKNWNRMCRCGVPYWAEEEDGISYATNAVDAVFNSNGYVALALDRPYHYAKYTLKGFALLLTHEFDTTLKTPLGKPLKPKPVCDPDELYLDVICAKRTRRDRSPIGRQLYAHIERVAMSRLGRKAIRLHAIADKVGFWTKMGYVQADVLEKGKCKSDVTIKPYVYPQDPEQGVRMTKCIASAAA
jgi:ribosomal protein S18 acetylase RimI-like enzyme